MCDDSCQLNLVTDNKQKKIKTIQVKKVIFLKIKDNISKIPLRFRMVRVCYNFSIDSTLNLPC